SSCCRAKQLREFLASALLMVTPNIKTSHSGLLRFVLLSTLLSSCASPAAHAVDPNRRISQYGHTAWRIQDGTVPRSSTITQTKDGYIWMGTSDGLMRFDGVKFVKWHSAKNQKLPSRLFTALLGASDGSLWIGTSRGLSRLKDGELRNYSDAADSSGI